jgi:lipopolysaccharide export LptBFGC system permease protein LptF
MKSLDSLLEKIWKQGISSVIGWLSDSIPEKSKLTDYSYLMKETLFGKKLYQFLFTNLIPFKEELGKIFQQIEEQKQVIIAEKRDKKRKQQQQQQQQQQAKEEEEEEDYDYHDNNTVRMEEEQEESTSEDDEEGEEQEEEGENEDDKATKHAFSKMKSTNKLSVKDQRKKAQEFAERVLGLTFDKKTGKAKMAGAPKKGNIYRFILSFIRSFIHCFFLSPFSQKLQRKV